MIRRGVPAFRYRGRPLVSFGAAKHHLSLYLMYGSVFETHRAELNGFDTSKTVIGFTPDRPIPERLVVELAKARAAEIEAESARGLRGQQDQ